MTIRLPAKTSRLPGMQRGRRREEEEEEEEIDCCGCRAGHTAAAVGTNGIIALFGKQRYDDVKC